MHLQARERERGGREIGKTEKLTDRRTERERERERERKRERERDDLMKHVVVV